MVNKTAFEVKSLSECVAVWCAKSCVFEMEIWL